MKEEINQETLNDLKHFKNDMLLLNNRLYCISDFKYVTEKKVIKGNFLRKEKTVEVIYLTSLTVQTYSDKYKCVCSLVDHDAWRFVYFYSISGLRECWLDLKIQIEGFGAKVTMTEKNENN